MLPVIAVRLAFATHITRYTQLRPTVLVAATNRTCVLRLVQLVMLLVQITGRTKVASTLDNVPTHDAALDRRHTAVMLAIVIGYRRRSATHRLRPGPHRLHDSADVVKPLLLCQLATIRNPVGPLHVGDHIRTHATRLPVPCHA